MSTIKTYNVDSGDTTSLSLKTNGTTAITVNGSTQVVTLAKSPALSGSTSGSITLAAPAVAGSNTVTFPAATGTAMVSGNMPAFYATDTATTATASVATLISFDTEVFDTANAWNGSKFLPSVAGYYQINASVSNGTNYTNIGALTVSIRKNGSIVFGQSISYPAGYSLNASASGVVYLDGVSDYIEIYGINFANANLGGANVSGVLVRAA